jgi:hypothetical protein
VSERYPETVDEHVGTVCALDDAMEGLHVRFGFQAVLEDLFTTVQVQTTQGDPAHRAAWGELEQQLLGAMVFLASPRMRRPIVDLEETLKAVQLAKQASKKEVVQ